MRVIQIMKRLVLILTMCAVCALGLFRSLAPPPARAAAPKRLLLVTTGIGFRHACVLIFDQVFRQLAKTSGEFTVVSTTDSPDYPALIYKAAVDQRNARIPLSEAKDNDKPQAGSGFGGRGGIPNATPEQQAAVTAMNSSLTPLTQAATAATTALNNAIYSGSATPAELKAGADAVAAAELAVANARLEALAKTQASPARLNAEQVQALAQAGGRGGFGGAGGGRAGATPNAPQPQPLTPAQQTAVSAMNDSLRDQNQAVTAARTALSGAPYAAGTSVADLKAKADSLASATLALATRHAAEFGKIQASQYKLDSGQAQSLAQGGGRGGAGGRGGGAPDPALAGITKVLKEYMSPEALKNYDGVAFLSPNGELPIPDMDAFLKWVADGHAFIGLHSASDSLHTSPEYIKMLGGEFATHGAFHPAMPVVNVDRKSPITDGWGESITINEEFYLFRNFDFKQVHMLLEMKQQPYTKEPGEFPVSWIKTYGKGRVFYTSLGHRDDVIIPDAAIGDQEYKVRYNQNNVALAVQKHILDGVRWALGLIDADATPQTR
jgi:type 1 glutamine amidotransferase